MITLAVLFTYLCQIFCQKFNIKKLTRTDSSQSRVALTRTHSPTLSEESTGDNSEGPQPNLHPQEAFGELSELDDNFLCI